MASYLIADLHLSAQRPDLVRAFCCFCQQISDDAQALYILGDFFEAWIGDDYYDQTIEQVSLALQALKQQGCALYFIHGNRDFLLGDDFAQAAGLKILASDEVYHIENLSVILAHGDEYCWDDSDYQKFRKLVRNPWVQGAYRALPLRWRLTIANKARDRSKTDNQRKSQAIMDVSAHAIDDAFQRHGSQAKLMIHGHTHRPNIHRDKDSTRVVLGDWGASLWYVRIADHDWQLVEQAL